MVNHLFAIEIPELEMLNQSFDIYYDDFIAEIVVIKDEVPRMRKFYLQRRMSIFQGECQGMMLIVDVIRTDKCRICYAQMRMKFADLIWWHAGS
jgi:hypothetical protein